MRVPGNKVRTLLQWDPEALGEEAKKEWCHGLTKKRPAKKMAIIWKTKGEAEKS